MATRISCKPAARPLSGDARVETIVARLAALPATAGTNPRLLDVMAQRDATIEEIAAVIVSDRALSVRLLQVVNSAFFGLPFKVLSLPQAVSYVGLNSLRSLTLLATVFAAADSCATVPGFSAARLQRHSLLCARLARTLVADRRSRDDAFTGGLLQPRHASVGGRDEPALFAGLASGRAHRAALG
jgi:HD-like signal output (HDOD) protein